MSRHLDHVVVDLVERASDDHSALPALITRKPQQPSAPPSARAGGASRGDVRRGPARPRCDCDREHDYLDASLAAGREEQREREEAEQRTTAAEHGARRRTRQLVIGALAMALVVGLATFAWVQRQDARQAEADLAVNQAGQRLATLSVNTLSTDPELALLLAKEAVSATADPRLRPPRGDRRDPLGVAGARLAVHASGQRPLRRGSMVNPEMREIVSGIQDAIRSDDFRFDAMPAEVSTAFNAGMVQLFRQGSLENLDELSLEIARGIEAAWLELEAPSG